MMSAQNYLKLLFKKNYASRDYLGILMRRQAVLKHFPNNELILHLPKWSHSPIFVVLVL